MKKWFLTFLLALGSSVTAFSETLIFIDVDNNILKPQGQNTYSFKAYRKILVKPEIIEDEIFSQEVSGNKEARQIKVKYTKDGKNKWWIVTQSGEKIPSKVLISKKGLKSLSNETGSTHSMVELCPNPKKIINLADEVCSF